MRGLILRNSLVLGLAMISGQANSATCPKPFAMELAEGVVMEFCPVGEGDNAEFHIGQHEVTQAHYRTVVDQEPWLDGSGRTKYFAAEGEGIAASYISYQEAQRFIEVLNRRDRGKKDKKSTYRLPTTAEWRQAARTDLFSADRVYYQKNITGKEHAQPVTSCPNETQESGYCANDLGLLHMLGNVAEWTSDLQLCGGGADDVEHSIDAFLSCVAATSDADLAFAGFRVVRVSEKQAQRAAKQRAQQSEYRSPAGPTYRALPPPREPVDRKAQKRREKEDKRRRKYYEQAMQERFQQKQQRCAKLKGSINWYREGCDY